MFDKNSESFGAVDLPAAMRVLAKSGRVMKVLERKLGTKMAELALKMMKKGALEGGLGDSIHDLFSDEIYNEALEVWRGEMPTSEDVFPVWISEYEGVYWAQALEYDAAGYFLTLEQAKSFVFGTWDNAQEVEDADDDT